MFCARKNVLKIFSNKAPLLESLFNKVAGLYRIPLDNCFWNTSGSSEKVAIATVRCLEIIFSGT